MPLLLQHIKDCLVLLYLKHPKRRINMRRILLIFLCIFLIFIFSLSVRAFQLIGSGGVEPPGPTRELGWDGDHADGNKVAYVHDDANTRLGTENGTIEISNSYGYSGNGLRVNGLNESLEFANNSADIFDFTQGKVKMRIYVPSFAADDTYMPFFEGYVNSTNFFVFYVRDMAAGCNIRAEHYGGGVVNSSNLTAATWHLLEVEWNANDFGLRIRIDEGSWTTDATLNDLTTDCTDVNFGEADKNGNNKTIYMDNVDIWVTPDES
jgi:hypothetical protein